MESPRLIALTQADASRVVDLERRSFIPILRVTAETFCKRLSLGHRMLALEDGKELVGLAAFSYGNLNPADINTLPKSVKELCLQSVPKDFDTVFLYNLELDPRYRGGVLWKKLVAAALIKARSDGCAHGVANVRVVSYAGGASSQPEDRVAFKPKVRAAIDDYLRGGPFPPDQVLEKDPLLALYHRIPGCRFLWIVPNYAPGDEATGGIRVILYFDIPQDRSRL